MIAEVATLKLKFNPHPLPFSGFDLTLCLAIRKARLHSLDQISKLASYHAEEEYYPVLVHGLVSETTEINRISVRGTALQLGVMVAA